MPTRRVLLRHLTDGGIRSFIDDGCSIDGAPGVARQQLMNALAKTVKERDGNRQVVIGEDGFAVEWALFMLHEPPKPMPYNLADKAEAKCSRADRFDVDVLRRSGRWLLPDDRWLEASARHQGVRRGLHEQYDAAQVENMQINVGKGIQDLLSQVKANAAQAEKGPARVASKAAPSPA